MKLRNKKTGKLTEIEEINLVVWNAERDCYESFEGYHSLAELNKEWEDYKPAEPLIKDEKIRKAVRAWADVLGVERATYSGIDGEFYSGVNYIRLGQVNRPGSLKSDTYTIAELCGPSDSKEEQ